jgi:hypothetical protein
MSPRISKPQYRRILRQAIESELLLCIDAAHEDGDDDLAADLDLELDELLDTPYRGEAAMTHKAGDDAQSKRGPYGPRIATHHRLRASVDAGPGPERPACDAQGRRGRNHLP